MSDSSLRATVRERGNLACEPGTLSTLNLSVMSAAIVSCSCSSFVLVLETGNELSITITSRSTNGRPNCLPTKTKLTEL